MTDGRIMIEKNTNDSFGEQLTENIRLRTVGQSSQKNPISRLAEQARRTINTLENLTSLLESKHRSTEQVLRETGAIFKESMRKVKSAFIAIMQSLTGSSDSNNEQLESFGRDPVVNIDGSIEKAGEKRGGQGGCDLHKLGMASQSEASNNLTTPSSAPPVTPSPPNASATSAEDTVAYMKEHEPKEDGTGNSVKQIVREGALDSLARIKHTFKTQSGADSAREHGQSDVVQNESGGIDMAKSRGEDHNSSSTSPKLVTAIAIREDALEGMDPGIHGEPKTPIDVAHSQPALNREAVAASRVFEMHPTQHRGSNQGQIATGTIKTQSTSLAHKTDVINKLKTPEESPTDAGKQRNPDEHIIVRIANGEEKRNVSTSSGNESTPTHIDDVVNPATQHGDKHVLQKPPTQEQRGGASNQHISFGSQSLNTRSSKPAVESTTQKIDNPIQTENQRSPKKADKQDRDEKNPISQHDNPIVNNSEASKANAKKARIFTTPSADQNNQSNEEAKDQRSSKGSTGSVSHTTTPVDTTRNTEQLHDLPVAATTEIASGMATCASATSNMGNGKQPTKPTKPTESQPQVMVIDYIQSSFKLGTLQPFTGVVTDPYFSDWIRKYKNQIAASGEQDTEEPAKVSKFLTHLDGRALDRAEDFKAANPDITLEQLISKLRDYFEHKTYQMQAREQLHAIQQGKHEKIEDYHDRLTKLVKLSFGHDLDAKEQDYVKERFINGLLPVVGALVATREAHTLEEAYNSAIVLQPFANKLKDITSDTTETKETVLNIGKHTDEKDSREERQQKSNLSSRTHKSSTPFVNSKCYHCQKVGHITKYCFDKHGRKEAERRMRRDNVKTSKPRKPAEKHNQHGAAAQVKDRGAKRTSEVKQLDSKTDDTDAQIPIRANGMSTVALIDTGASITAAGSQHCASLGVTKLDQQGTGCATVFGNNSVTFIGSALVTITIGSRKYKHRVHFTDGPCTPDSYMLIIGRDLMKRMPLVSFDINKSKLYIGNEVFPLGVKKSTTRTSPAMVNQIAAKKDITQVPTCMVIQAGPEVFTAHGSSKGLSLAKAQEKDPEIQRVKRFLEDPSSTEDLPEHWISIAHLLEVSEHGTLMINFIETGQKTIVPEQLKKTIYKSFHENAASGGHLFWKKSLEKAQRRYYWPNMQKNFFEWTRQCLPCQRRRSVHPSARELQAIVCTTAVFEKVGLDLTGPLRESSRGNKYYINVVDWFTKYVISVPVKDATTDTVTRVLLEEVILKYGTPAQLISDNASGFTSGEFNNFKTLLKLEHHFSIPHHSRGNGATERTFRTFHSMVGKYINCKHDNWDTILPCVTFAYNSAVHSTTGESPFYLMFGRDPVFTIDRMLNDPPTDEGDDYAYTGNWRECITSTLRKAWKSAEDHSRLAQLAYQKSANKGALGSGIRLGDRVLIKNYKSKVGQSRKLVQPYIEGFRVIEMSSSKNSRGEVVIQQISDPTVTKRVHLNQIKKHYVAEEEPRKKKDAKKTKQPTQATPAETTEEASADVDEEEASTPLEILKPTQDVPTLPLKLKEIKEIRKNKAAKDKQIKQDKLVKQVKQNKQVKKDKQKLKEDKQTKQDKQVKQDKQDKPAKPAKADPPAKEEPTGRRNPERQRRAPARYLRSTQRRRNQENFSNRFRHVLDDSITQQAPKSRTILGFNTNSSLSFAQDQPYTGLQSDPKDKDTDNTTSRQERSLIALTKVQAEPQETSNVRPQGPKNKPRHIQSNGTDTSLVTHLKQHHKLKEIINNAQKDSKSNVNPQGEQHQTIKSRTTSATGIQHQSQTYHLRSANAYTAKSLSRTPTSSSRQDSQSQPTTVKTLTPVYKEGQQVYSIQPKLSSYQAKLSSHEPSHLS
ncbi:hypothetical protein CAEBREN_22792 [Caenorhabditis brenneri]|uniref:RNA-directed DNA polymerase n=1 Tax=Caenorhabditis brenneri TaxID=135651 RepID=G0MH75_CAEBE|nr:hypothetical protein CAEBREN_22792 [Caenorhabditis brenneri]